MILTYILLPILAIMVIINMIEDYKLKISIININQRLNRLTKDKFLPGKEIIEIGYELECLEGSISKNLKQ